MPVYSMTGYASAQHTREKSTTNGSAAAPPAGQLELEIRSVNSRFLDLTLRLPEELRQFEPTLREIVTAQLKRGKVEVRVAFTTNERATLIAPTAPLLQKLGAIQDQIKAWLPQATALSVAEVISLTAGEQASGHDWGQELPALCQQVMKALLRARQREGDRLAAMLLERVLALRALANRAAPLVPKLVALQRQRFLDRWREAMGLTDSGTLPEAAQDRALTEATAFAIRIDVAEEITRLYSHLDEIERLLQVGGELGKRLDFLIQELHREANTFGSKSAMLELTQISVEMKVLIEQMREQVQNLE